jgi:flagellin-like hook-associated protein FlgL
LPALVVGVDFLDNAGANKVLNSLTAASGQLRSQASTLGANLSIVQIRQDFAKNLINVLQTGSSNLTLADTNEEAANSQALSTRQSIAVSALSLANQSQQSVLQLLR